MYMGNLSLNLNKDPIVKLLLFITLKSIYVQNLFRTGNILKKARKWIVALRKLGEDSKGLAIALFGGCSCMYHRNDYQKQLNVTKSEIFIKQGSSKERESSVTSL